MVNTTFAVYFNHVSGYRQPTLMPARLPNLTECLVPPEMLQDPHACRGEEENPTHDKDG